jgi:hypothetical protein
MKKEWEPYKLSQFVPYEQALELKELGFDEHCFKYFSTEITHPENTLFNTRWRYESEDSEISAKLYQQVFRWFREKYKIRFIIQSSMSDLDEFFKVIFPNGVQRGVSCNTYEEAELECIKKLIEIAKNK